VKLLTSPLSQLRRPVFRSGALATLLVVALGTACGDDSPDGTTGPNPNCAAAAGSAPSNAMTVLGCGNFTPSRTTGEIFVRGTTAYTTTWSNSSTAGSVFYIWDASSDSPTLVDSVKVDNATTLGDIAVTDDGAYLVVATERAPGSIVIYSLTNPRQPQLVSRAAQVVGAFDLITAQRVGM